MTPQLSRRRFLRGSALLGAGMLARGVAPGILRAQSGPRIVIVGGGLAGLTTAYQLWSRYGLAADVYEAKSELGGRASTARGFTGGQHIERGGQFISSGDRRIRKLVRSLGLSLIDTNQLGADGVETFRFLGEAYTYQQLEAALLQAEENAWTHVREAGRQVSWDHKNVRTEHWDNVTVTDWIDNYCPGGLAGAAGQYLKARFETEYAGPIGEASALQIIYDLGLSSSAAAYDERYIVQGGTDTIVSALSSQLPNGRVHTDMALLHLQPNGDGSVRCRFASAVATVDVDADRVVLALPFSTLRDVDYSQMGFDARMVAAIQGLGMGTNAKVHLHFDAAAWQPSFNGDSLSDLASGSTWEEQIGQTGAQRFLNLFNGGSFSTQYGTAAAHGPAPAAVVSSHLAAVESIFPWAAAVYNGEGKSFHFCSPDAGRRKIISFLLARRWQAENHFISARQKLAAARCSPGRGVQKSRLA